MGVVMSIEIEISAPETVETAAGEALGGPALVPYVDQEQGEWCWAACMQMVLQAKGSSPSHCQMACQAFGHLTCCPFPSSSQCDLPLPIDSISSEWGRYGCSAFFVPA